MRESLLNVSGPTLINGGQFSIVNNYLTPSLPRMTSGFDRLHAQIAVAALHNALDSFDSGRCHPNTRQMVLHDLFQFIRDDPKTRKNWILWLSGPAGSGKTTIARTLAYLCDEKDLNQASFFFCRMDLTRNGIKPLVATLAHQIACRWPSVRDVIAAEVELRPQIFELSVEEQFRSLITGPLNNVQALHTLVSGKDSPVIFMVASRAEPNLRMAFNRIRHSVARVYLDNSYDPSVDIHRYVVDKFEEIRTIHPFAPSLPHDWPKPSAVDAIVAKSSGQFIYAATVMQYVSSPWFDPAESLDNISDSLSAESSINPFIDLDILFAFVLGRAMSWPVVSIILSCHILSCKLSDVWFSLLLDSSGHSVKSIRRDLVDITALVELDNERSRLIIHNESLVDFLVNPERSGHFHVNLGRAAHDILLTVLRIRSRDNVHLVVDYIIALLPKVTDPSGEMRTLLLEFSREAVTIHPEPFLTEYGRCVLLRAFSSRHIGYPDSYMCQRIWREWPAEIRDGRPYLRLALPYKRMSIARLDLVPGSRYEAESGSSHTLQPSHLILGSPAWFQNELRDVDMRDIKHILASVLISEATGMLFVTITDILGYDSFDCARILAPLSSLLEYNSEDHIITFHHGRGLLNCLSNRGSAIYSIKVEETATQTVIRMLSRSDSYKGNLFGDLSALLFFIKSPTTDLLSQLKQFAMLLLVSSLDVHILDFTTFLDALGCMPLVNDITASYTPGAHYRERPHPPQDPACSNPAQEVHQDISILHMHSQLTASGPEVTETLTPKQTFSYIELLTPFVQLWASKHEQMDPLLLGVREVGRIWEEVVHTK
ncbi:hypothetical protein D9619_003951 [Psilocybe cf. subviscida]|uniref:Nephrocystin 3-like N-terminal domain-containing protein n=1 Tax=Psilocybe cf. subviscida TaxID=2480587 RepID=A0A8H5F898_9AGAR|nr:hypothetical protein D9619_003951 [Psilocybe cf. subviscida]